MALASLGGFRARIALLIGVVMIALGAFVAVRLLWGLPPLTRSIVLDATFAGFFILRGTMNIRAGRRLPLYGSTQDAPPT